MNIKAIVFDYGKVICFPPADEVMDEIADLAGIEWKVIEPIYRKLRGEYDRGTFALAADFYRKILLELDCKADDETLKKMGKLDLDSWKEINPATVKLMEDIKKAGYKLGILSNMPFDFLDFIRNNISVINLPHAALFSCELGIIKPEKAIYQKLISVMDCRPQELVFFDDVLENVEKAKELGVEARLWLDCEKARLDLADLGVKL